MLKLFYHIYSTGDQYGDMFFVDEQIKRLQYTELIDVASVHAVITGPTHDALWHLVDRSRKIRILDVVQGQNGLYEGNTLGLIQNEINSSDTVIYMHTKGLSYIMGPRRVSGSFTARHLKAINGWKEVMEYNIIDQWQVRLSLVDQCDSQGCFLRQKPFAHYMGNFWWASGDYICQLPDPKTFSVKPYPGMEFEETAPDRMRYEQWILLNPGRHLDIIPYPKDATKPMPGYTEEFSPYEDDISEV